MSCGLIMLGRARPETGYALMAELLTRTRPEAICIGNGRLAVGALHALQQAGLRVPGDIRVGAFYPVAITATPRAGAGEAWIPSAAD